MERAPRFPSLFFRQRLNATVLPMLGGIFLFLLFHAFLATLLLVLLSVPVVFLTVRREGENRKQLLCVLLGFSFALLLMGGRGFEKARLEKLCHTPRAAQGYVVEKGDGYYDLSLTHLDGKSFRKRVRVETDADWKQGEKREVILYLHSPDPAEERGEGVELLAYCRKDSGVIGKSRLYSLIGSVRQSLLSDFSKRENGGFLSAVLLGERGGLTETQTDAFRRTASSHVLAISGLHISQAIAFAVCLFNLFPISRNATRILLYPFVLVLYLLAGAGVSVFRAGVMTLFSMTGLLLRYRSDSATALCFSAALLVVFNPYALESPSFLLSYSSTFGLVTCAVPLSEYVKLRFTEKKMNTLLKLCTPTVLSLVFASVSFVFTMPVQLILFGTASPFAPLYAVLLIPLFQICLILSLLGTVGLPFCSASVEKLLLDLPAKFPDFVEFLAKGAPAPMQIGEAGVWIALFFITVLTVMFWKRVPLTGVFLLHGIIFLFLGAFSLIQSLLL